MELSISDRLLETTKLNERINFIERDGWSIHISKSGWIKEFVVRVRVVEVQTKEYTSFYLSEEMMWLQLMFCTLPNPLLSQFWMGIGLD